MWTAHCAPAAAVRCRSRRSTSRCNSTSGVYPLAAGAPWIGEMDEVRIWGRALSWSRDWLRTAPSACSPRQKTSLRSGVSTSAAGSFVDRRNRQRSLRHERFRHDADSSRRSTSRATSRRRTLRSTTACRRTIPTNDTLSFTVVTPPQRGTLGDHRRQQWRLHLHAERQRQR
jgi:hypothetical protein